VILLSVYHKTNGESLLIYIAYFRY